MNSMPIYSEMHAGKSERTKIQQKTDSNQDSFQTMLSDKKQDSEKVSYGEKEESDTDAAGEAQGNQNEKNQSSVIGDQSVLSQEIFSSLFPEVLILPINQDNTQTVQTMQTMWQQGESAEKKNALSGVDSVKSEKTEWSVPEQSNGISDAQAVTLSGTQKTSVEDERADINENPEPVQSVSEQRSDSIREGRDKAELKGETVAIQGQDMYRQTTSPEILVTEKTQVKIQQPEELPQKLAERISDSIINGKREIEIQLEPDNLGKILVKVVQETDKTVVSIFCEEASAKGIVSQHAKTIGDIMEQNLGIPTLFVVDEKEAGYLQQQSEHHRNQRQQQGQQESEHQNKDKDYQENTDFLQQLRLGLVS